MRREGQRGKEKLNMTRENLVKKGADDKTRDTRWGCE